MEPHEAAVVKLNQQIILLHFTGPTVPITARVHSTPSLPFPFSHPVSSSPLSPTALPKTLKLNRQYRHIVIVQAELLEFIGAAQDAEGTAERKAKLHALKTLQESALISPEDFAQTRQHILRRLREGVPATVRRVFLTTNRYTSKLRLQDGAPAIKGVSSYRRRVRDGYQGHWLLNTAATKGTQPVCRPASADWPTLARARLRAQSRARARHGHLGSKGSKGSTGNSRLWHLLSVREYFGGESISPVVEWLNKGLTDNKASDPLHTPSTPPPHPLHTPSTPPSDSLEWYGGLIRA
eukprot:1196253-Prorocentrum_minimum.AAC.2